MTAAIEGGILGKLVCQSIGGEPARVVALAYDQQSQSFRALLHFDDGKFEDVAAVHVHIAPEPKRERPAPTAIPGPGVRMR